jgi:hypothetical protein
MNDPKNPGSEIFGVRVILPTNGGHPNQELINASNTSICAIVALPPLCMLRSKGKNVPVKTHKSASRPFWKPLGEINSFDIIKSAWRFELPMRLCGNLPAPIPALRLSHALSGYQAVFFAFALARMKSAMRATPLFIGRSAVQIHQK